MWKKPFKKRREREQTINWDKLKTNSKMIVLNLTIPLITMTVNGLNTLIKEQRLSDKKRPNYNICSLLEVKFIHKNTKSQDWSQQGEG